MYRVILNGSERWYHTQEEAIEEYKRFKELKLVVGGETGETIRLDYCGDAGDSLPIRKAVLREIEGCFDESGMPNEIAVAVDVWAEWIEEEVPFAK